MSKKQYLLSLMAVAMVFLSLSGCAAAPSVPGRIGDSPDTYALTGFAGEDNMFRPRLYRLPPSCAGRTVELRAEYRTEGIRGGTRSYHGIHFDYEVYVSSGAPMYPSDWKVEPSAEWQSISKSWDIPAGMRSGYVRIGLQGVDGRLYVRGITVTGC